MTLSIILGYEKQLYFLRELYEVLEENIKICNDQLKYLGVEEDQMINEKIVDELNNDLFKEYYNDEYYAFIKNYTLYIMERKNCDIRLKIEKPNNMVYVDTNGTLVEFGFMINVCRIVDGGDWY